MKQAPDPTIAVVGGGISGLATALEMTGMRGSHRIVVLEGSSRFGGKIRAETIGGRRPEAVDLCEAIGLAGDLVEPGVKGALVWSRHELRPLPDGLALGVPTRLGPLARSAILSCRGVARAAMDLLRPPGVGGSAGARTPTDAPVGELVRSRLGREVAARLADPLIGGINAGPVDDMSAESVFPVLLEAAASGGSLMRALRKRFKPDQARATPEPMFLAPKGGMTRLVDALVAELASRSVELWSDSRVQDLSAEGSKWRLSTPGAELVADAVVMATDHQDAGAILGRALPEVSAALSSMDAASVAVVTMAFPEDAAAARGATGFLVPSVQGMLMTGCTWMSNKWPAIARPGELLLRVSCGRFGDERAAGLDDDALVERLVAELVAVMGLSGEPTETVVTRWESAFPQYRVGHMARVGRLEQMAAASPAPLALAGAAFRGVGIPACVDSAKRGARSVLERVGSTTGAHPPNVCNGFAGAG